MHLPANLRKDSWQISPAFIQGTALPPKEVVDVRLQSLHHKIQLANLLHQKGRTLLESQNTHHSALVEFSNAISIFEYFKTARGTLNIYTSNSLQQIDKEVEEVHALLARCYYGVAICLFRQQAMKDAIYSASQALRHDPYHSKAFSLRAEARMCCEDAGIVNLAAVVSDFHEALRLDPGDNKVRAALCKAQGALLEQQRDTHSRSSASLKSDPADQDDDLESEAAEVHLHAQRDPDSIQAADFAFQGMKRSIRKARQVASEQAIQQEMARAQSSSPFLSLRLFKLPLWAIALILVHLMYRVSKIFSTVPENTSSSFRGDDSAFTTAPMSISNINAGEL